MGLNYSSLCLFYSRVYLLMYLLLLLLCGNIMEIIFLKGMVCYNNNFGNSHAIIQCRRDFLFW